MATTPTSLAQFKSNFQSSGIVSKDLLNRIDRQLSNITGSNGITVTSDFGRGIRIIGESAKNLLTDFYKRWRLDFTTSTKMTVNGGRHWNVGTTLLEYGDTTIEGIGDCVAAAVGGIPNTTPFTPSTWHFVWLALYHATTDKQLTADVLKVHCDVAFTAELTRNRDLYKEIGAFYVEADGTILSSNVIRYWIGDIDKVIPIPDGELNPALAYPLRTLEWRRNFWEWQIWDADEAKLWNGSTPPAGTAWANHWGIAGIKKGANNDGDVSWVGIDSDGTAVGAAGQKSLEINDTTKVWQIKNVNENSVAQTYGGGFDFCIRTAKSGEVKWVDEADAKVGYAAAAGTADYVTYAAHSALTDIVANNYGDDHHGARTPVAGTPAYIAGSGDYSRNAMTTGLGDSSGLTSVAVHLRYLYDHDELLSLDWDNKLAVDSAGKTSINWGTARTLADSAGTAVMCWDTLNGTPVKNWHLTWGTGNLWTPTEFNAFVTGGAALVAGTGTVGMSSSSGIFSISAGSASASIIQSPKTCIIPVTSGVDNFYVGNQGGVPTPFALARIDATRLDLAIDSATMNIYFANVVGRSITGWTDKGGLTGTGVEEITWGDIRPTDRILVRR
jgi:hypothetical protein